MRANLALLATTVLLSGVAFAASPPSPVTSEYLLSTTAGFAMDADRGIYYTVRFSIRKPLGGVACATVEFENPEVPGSPFQTLLSVPADATEISAESPRLPSIGNGKRYSVTARIYRDESRTVLLTRHVRDVLFAVRRQLRSQIESVYGVQIR